MFAGFSLIGTDFLADPDLGYARVPGLGASQFHMLFSRNQAGENLRKVMDRGIGKMEASGRLDAILQKYKK